MDFKLIILSVACFASLVPSALSINILAAKAVAGQAAEDLTAIGAKTLVAKKEAMAKAGSELAALAAQGLTRKGEILTKAATSIAGALINGAASKLTRIAKAGLDIVAAKFSGIQPLEQQSTIVIKPPVLHDTIVEEVVVPEPIVEYAEEIEVPVEVVQPISTVTVDVMPQFVDIPAPPQLPPIWTVDEVQPAFQIVQPANSPYIYEIVETPQAYGPLVETFRFKK